MAPDWLRPPQRPRPRPSRRRLLGFALAGCALLAGLILILDRAHSSGVRRDAGFRRSTPARATSPQARSRGSRERAVHVAARGGLRDTAPVRPSRRLRMASHRRSPGSLPQTNAFPSARTARFRREMSSLWQAIVTDRPRSARPAFFPEGAYLQLKAIAGAASDFEERLLRDYALDIGAAHALLGHGAAGAVLVGVRVPSSYGHWVPPGVCYNRVGYYEVPNSRVLYREHGQLRSFGIASMISWRGVWYVVHLGAILRSGVEGVVDRPAIGPGVSEPSSTC